MLPQGGRVTSGGLDRLDLRPVPTAVAMRRLSLSKPRGRGRVAAGVSTGSTSGAEWVAAGGLDRLDLRGLRRGLGQVTAGQD